MKENKKNTKVEMSAEELKAVSGGQLSSLQLQVSVNPNISTLLAGSFRHW